MAAGFVHIVGVGTVEDSGGLRIPQYQFTFNDGGISYARTFDEAQLVEFLTEEVGILPDILDNALAEARRDGHTTIPDVAISHNQAAAFGLIPAGSDY